MSLSKWKEKFLIRLSYFVYNKTLNCPNSRLVRFYNLIQSLLIRYKNPIITTKFQNITLTRPLSHPLFIILRECPFYERILEGIVAHICDKYGKLSMVDVGANIGDSAIFSLIKGGSYLLVEGALEYATLIESNLRHNVKTRLYTDANPPHLAKRYYTKDYEGQEDQSFLVYGGIFLGEGDLSNYQLQLLENGSAKLINRNTTTQQHNNTTTQQHNNTTTQQHNNTTTQQHNNTTTQQHNNTTTHA